MMEMVADKAGCKALIALEWSDTFAIGASGPLRSVRRTSALGAGRSPLCCCTALHRYRDTGGFTIRSRCSNVGSSLLYMAAPIVIWSALHTSTRVVSASSLRCHVRLLSVVLGSSGRRMYGTGAI